MARLLSRPRRRPRIRRSRWRARRATRCAPRSTSARPRAGDRVGGFASDTRSVGEELRKQGKDRPAKLADQVSDRAERLGDYLKQSDADRILHDVEDFGRRQPWAVIAGGMALGIVASRFLKASSSSRYEQRSGQSYGQLPTRSSYETPATSGIQTTPVTTGPAIPTTPPTGATGFEGGR